MNFKNFAIVIAATALLGACGGLELGKAQHASPSGDAFSKSPSGKFMF
jgi:hypothetical protein